MTFNSNLFNTTLFNDAGGVEEVVFVNSLSQVWSYPGISDNNLSQLWDQGAPGDVEDNNLSQLWDQGAPDNIEDGQFSQLWAILPLDFEEINSLNQLWDKFGLVFSPLTVAYRVNVESEMVVELRLSVESPLEVLSSFRVESPLEVSVPLPGPIPEPGVMDVRYGDKVRVESPLTVEYNIRFGLVTSPLTVAYDIKSTNPVSSELAIVYSLLDEQAINVTGGIEVTLVKTGEAIRIIRGTLDISEGSFEWSGQIQLADPSDFGKFDFDDEVTLKIPDFANPGDFDTYNMVVDAKDLSRPGPAQFSATIRLISKSARLDTPRAQPFTGNFTADINASDAIAQILDINPMDLGFDVEDWVILANRLGGEAVSPVELASQIARATGGLLETNPDGSVYVRYAYPVPVADYGTATPDEQYTEQDTILAKSEGYQAQQLVNRIRIRDAADSTFGDRVEFTADDTDPRKGILGVFPSPFRDINVEATTTDPPVTVTKIGENTETLEEFVEIKDGFGQISKPITGSPLEVEFLTLNLGGVVIEEGSTTVNVTSSGGDGYTLVRIKYNTRFIAFLVESDNDRSVQFLVRDSE